MLNAACINIAKHTTAACTLCKLLWDLTACTSRHRAKALSRIADIAAVKAIQLHSYRLYSSLHNIYTIASRVKSCFFYIYSYSLEASTVWTIVLWTSTIIIMTMQPCSTSNYPGMPACMFGRIRWHNYFHR